jgi:hypothetical protein
MQPCITRSGLSRAKYGHITPLRAPYVEAAAADKACYERKMLAYQPICDQCWPAPLMESSGDEYTDYDGWDDCG